MKTTVLERTEPMNERLKAAAVLLVIALQIPLPASGQQAPAQGQTQPPGQTQAPPSATSAPLPPAKPAAQPRQLTLTPDYSAGRFFFPYTPRQVAEPMLTNSPRIDQLIQNGKLMLSLEDAISLALENNMDIAVQRFTPWLDETALLRSLSGVNGRLVFDPVLTGHRLHLASLHARQQSFPRRRQYRPPLACPWLPTSSPTTEWPISPTPRAFAPGTQLQVTFNNTRSSLNFAANLFNPYSESFLTVQVTQPLLNGFGKLPNTRFILEAKNTVKVGESQFAQQVINTVTQVSNDYWELVFARENVKVEQATVAVDQQLYENNKKQLEIGTMAPLDVITAAVAACLRSAGPGAGADHATAGRNHAAGGHHQRSAGHVALRRRDRTHHSYFHSRSDRKYSAADGRSRSLAEAAGTSASRAEPEKCGDRGAGHQERAPADGEHVRAVRADRHRGRFAYHNFHGDRFCLRSHRAGAFRQRHAGHAGHSGAADFCRRCKL